MGKENSRLCTPVEINVLQLLSQGLTEREVALEMNKSVYTIDKYLRGIFEKFNVHNTTSAVAEALRRNEIE